MMYVVGNIAPERRKYWEIEDIDLGYVEYCPERRKYWDKGEH
jgi:hypothetical protein